MIKYFDWLPQIEKLEGVVGIEGEMAIFRYSDIKDHFSLHDTVGKPYKFNFHIMFHHTSGSVKFKLDMVEHDLPKPNNIARIMCGQILMLEEASDDFDGVVVVMSNSFVEGLLVHIDNALPLQAKMLGHNSVKPLSESEKALPEMFLKAAYQVLKDDENPFRRNVLEHVILAIFYSSEEVRKQFDGDSSGYSSAESITKEFLKLVKVNFRSERQLQFYSDKLCITPRYLSRVVKESTGSSAADWIERYVVLEARALLKSTNMTIQQISDDLNFPSQTFFGKYFKRRVGVSPKSYRREG